MFNRRYAERDARTFRERGLGKTSRALVELAGDVEGERVLDVGGGIGAIGLSLLERGAAHATNVELSGGYEQAAAELIAERDVEGRVERRVADFVEAADVPPHDVVVLHRVVCCYPDVDELVGAASDRTRRVLLLTYPQERLWVRAGLRAVNVWLRLTRCGFRTYVHPFARIAAAAEAHGLRLERRERKGRLWESSSFARL
jgi:magnesium-protoporphyrin O-methyltransferase